MPPQAQPDFEPPVDQQIHWRVYAQIFWERKWITLTVLVVVATLTLMYDFKIVPLYRSSAKIEIEGDQPKLLNIQDVLSTDTRNQEYINTQVRILQSRPIAEQVVKTLSLTNCPDFMPGASSGTDFEGALLRCLNIQQERGTRIINVTISHENPKMTALLANGVAQAFIKQNGERRMSASLEAITWLGKQSEEYRAKMEKSEAAVQEYREKTRDVSLEESYNIVLDKLKEINGALMSARTARLTAETEWLQIKSLIDKGQSPTAVAAIAADAEVSDLRVQLTQKQIALSALKERYKDKYPVMVAALRELKEIQDKLDKAATNALQKKQAEYLMAKAKEESLQQPLSDQEQRALELGRKLMSYSMLKRNAESDRQLYEALLTRMKEAGLTGKLELNNMRVIDPALVPAAPFYPDKKNHLLYAVVLGLLAGFGLSYGAHLYDDKIKAYGDVETYLGLPLLGEVPRIDTRGVAEKARVVQLEPHSMAAEAFSNLRATIGVAPAARTAKVILVTSTAPSEGKSLVASNMAIAFAHDNQRTLLIDADMRHPVVQRSYNMDSDKGLSAYLTNGTGMEEIIHSSEVPNLDIIVVGKSPSNPAELLGSARMRILIEQVTQRYDRIIIDTPPVAVVSDPLVLVRHAEGVVFVTHFRKIRRDAIARAVRKLREIRAPVWGVVLNNIDVKKHGYYYYPYHYSSYYYHQKTDRQRELLNKAGVDEY